MRQINLKALACTSALNRIVSMWRGRGHTRMHPRVQNQSWSWFEISDQRRNVETAAKHLATIEQNVADQTTPADVNRRVNDRTFVERRLMRGRVVSNGASSRLKGRSLIMQAGTWASVRHSAAASELNEGGQCRVRRGWKQQLKNWSRGRTQVHFLNMLTCYCFHFMK